MNAYLRKAVVAATGLGLAVAAGLAVVVRLRRVVGVLGTGLGGRERGGGGQLRRGHRELGRGREGGGLGEGRGGREGRGVGSGWDGRGRQEFRSRREFRGRRCRRGRRGDLRDGRLDRVGEGRGLVRRQLAVGRLEYGVEEVGDRSEHRTEVAEALGLGEQRTGVDGKGRLGRGGAALTGGAVRRERGGGGDAEDEGGAQSGGRDTPYGQTTHETSFRLRQVSNPPCE